MKVKKEMIYKLLQIKDKDVVKVDGGTYQIDGFTLKHLRGNANYHNQHLLLLFDREETIEKVCNTVCNTNCTACPLRILDCLDASGDQPIGISLYEVLDALISAYDEHEDVKTFFKNRIDEYVKELTKHE